MIFEALCNVEVYLRHINLLFTFSRLAFLGPMVVMICGEKTVTMGVGSSNVEKAEGGHGELFLLFFRFFSLFLFVLLAVAVAAVAAAAAVVVVVAVAVAFVVEDSNATAEKCKEQQTSKKGKAIQMKHIRQRSRESTQAKKSKKQIKAEKTETGKRKQRNPRTTSNINCQDKRPSIDLKHLMCLNCLNTLDNGV